MIKVPSNQNPLLSEILKLINTNEEVAALWQVINVNAIDRLGMPDHGHVHFEIVSNLSLKISRLLHESGVEFSIQKDFGLSYHHAELVIVLASLLHDLGMSIHRDDHETYSLFLANNLLRESLTFLPIKERVIVTSETLHAIISHRSDGKPYTIEAGIVRVADALDMTEGRSRIPYLAGANDIFSVSAAAIDKLTIEKGAGKPVAITIFMTNSAGIFQIDQLLQKKLRGSGIEKYLTIVATIKSGTEKNLVTKVTL
jgi:uncharacterized protein